MMFASIFFSQTEVPPFEYVQEAFKSLFNAGFCRTRKSLTIFFHLQIQASCKHDVCINIFFHKLKYRLLNMCKKLLKDF